MSKNPSDEVGILSTWHFFYRETVKHKALLTAAFLAPVGVVLMSVVVPFYASKVLAGIVQQDQELTSYLILLAAGSVGGVIANYVGVTRLFVLQARAMSSLHHMLFERLLQRSIGFHVNRIGGKLISDAIDFVNSYGALVNAAFLTALPFAVSILLGLVIVFFSSWQLGIYLTVVVTIILTWAWIESRTRAALRNRRLVATKALTAHLSDSIVNAPTVKTFAQEHHEITRNVQLNTALEKLRVRDWQRAARSANKRAAVLLLLQFGMILLIIKLTRDSPAILAAGIFAFTYTLTLSNRLFEINTLTRQIEEAFLNASPMTAMLLEAVEIQDKPDAGTLTVPRGRIDVTDMSFAYPEKANDTAVFSKLNLTIQPGEKIGLVGPSGGGKTTLTRLLLRFDEVQDGTITIDGQNISDVTQASLRQAIAYVPQEPLLFHRSIRENIAYGKPGASEEEIIDAARRANADIFIRSLPEGYSTIVGERGVKLSGGQRQRVAIARAILKDAPVLVLDEATSALDSENEQQVQEALWHLMQGRTTVVIAHRLSTIQKMDRILVLEEGVVTEEGTHRQLLRRKGTYARLWSHQSGGFIEE
jgi:ATP-binding cassette, subfamily B, bacterial